MAVNLSLIDRWSAVHGLMGLGIGLAGVRPAAAIGGSLAYEVIEHHHERHGSAIFGTKQPESLKNVAGDSAIYTVAFLAGRSAHNHELGQAAAIGTLTAAAFLTWIFSPLKDGARH